MTIHLPEELERSIRSLVQRGQFASMDEALAEAARLLLRESGDTPPTQPPDDVNDPVPDLFLGSMREAADELDEIVADAYRKRREEKWRDIEVE